MSKLEHFDFTKQAADYLRENGNRLNAEIRSGHAHRLVAATFGYGSRKAMQDDPNGPVLDSQWLAQDANNIENLAATIVRMKDAPVQSSQAADIARIVQEGLTPVCRECGQHNVQSMPLGLLQTGDDADWICPRCAKDEDQFGHCRCCGDDVLYPVDELDSQGVCPDHKGEFDLTPEEEEDWEIYIENVQNNC